MSFKYVYLLVSEADPEQHYVGQTDDLRARLAKHNFRGRSLNRSSAPMAHRSGGSISLG